MFSSKKKKKKKKKKTSETNEKHFCILAEVLLPTETLLYVQPVDECKLLVVERRDSTGVFSSLPLKIHLPIAVLTPR